MNCRMRRAGCCVVFLIDGVFASFMFVCSYLDTLFIL